jgi:glycosyltransferase involved in cell wall biosynthesis
MNNLPLISIISPTYNHAKFIAECIRSVQAQTYQNWEMIIVDDGSTDDTFAIATHYAQQDTRIKAYTQKNIGPFRLGETYNFALNISQGKYIAILECDDIWENNKLEKQIEGLENNEGCVLSWGAAYTIDAASNRGKKINPDVPLSKKIFENNPVKSIIPHLLLQDFVPAMTIIFRRSVLEQLGGFIQDTKIPSIDHTTLLEAALIGSFLFVDKPLGAWRYYPDQVTKTHAIKIYENVFRMAMHFYGMHPNLFPYKASFIADHYKHRLVIAYSRSGRYKLIKKDFKGARKDYLHSIFHYGLREPIWKIRSIIGLAMSLFHSDVEWMAQLLGRMNYK